MHRESKPQQKQDEIYRKMPAAKKLEITFQLYKTGKILQEFNDRRKVPRHRGSKIKIIPRTREINLKSLAPPTI